MDKLKQGNMLITQDLFEQEQKSRELEGKLDATINFLREPLLLQQNQHHKSLLFET
jgi:hypothetical protein